MRKKVSVTLSDSGIEKLKSHLEEYKKYLDKKTGEFVKKLAWQGVRIARVQYSAALYTGQNDSKVQCTMTSENTAVVRAYGSIVLFIEFGTGITYPDIHPNAQEMGMHRGEYGYHLGRFPRWRYEGDPGNLGKVIPEGQKHAGEVITEGMPAQMPIYYTIGDLERLCETVARRVFG